MSPHRIAIARIWILGTSILAFFLALTPALRADATIRYKVEFKPGAMLPPSVVSQASKTAQTAGESTIRVKGDKEAVATGKDVFLLIDFARQQITDLDSKNSLCATVYMKDYLSASGAAMPSMPTFPPQVKAILQLMKANFTANKTGRTDVVQGVNVEEVEWSFSLELPPGALPLPGVPTGQPLVLVKVTGEAWNAEDRERQRVPALGELMAHKSLVSYMFNPDNFLKPMADYPGLRDGLAPTIEKFVNDPPVTLKLKMEIYIPVVAQIAPLAKAQGTKMPDGLDPNAPLGELDMEVAEISNAPIADSVFQVPSNYRETSIAEIIKAGPSDATGTAGTGANRTKPAASAPTGGSAAANH